MLKKRIGLVLIVMSLFTTVIYGNTPSIDTSQVAQGIAKISYQSPGQNRAKVMVSKGSTKYTYDLNEKGQFPLQMGNGEYAVSILENVEGKKYRVVKSENINVSIADPNAVYLQSIDMINWNHQMKAIKKAEVLTSSATTNEEKAKIIYDYVSSKIKYDNAKAASVSAGYIPSIDRTLDTSLGICFDYAALYAGMLRSVGVPTKMLMGYKNDIADYHAWNEVYLEETKQWVTVDTTYDSAKVQNGLDTTMIKNKSQYKIEKQY